MYVRSFMCTHAFNHSLVNGHIVIADLAKYNLIQWFIENVNSARVYFELHLWMLHNIMWYLNYIHLNTGWVEWHFYVLIPIVICKLTIHRVLHVHVYMNRHINSTQSSYVVSHYRTSSFVKSVIMIFYFLAFDYCQFCVVIRCFHSRHNGQWPTSKDFLPQSLSITFIFLS